MDVHEYRRNAYIIDSAYMYVLSCLCLSATPWLVAQKASMCMGFSRQEYCSGFPFPSPYYRQEQVK